MHRGRSEHGDPPDEENPDLKETLGLQQNTKDLPIHQTR